MLPRFLLHNQPEAAQQAPQQKATEPGPLGHLALLLKLWL
jgi:hypothetical protein